MTRAKNRRSNLKYLSFASVIVLIPVAVLAAIGVITLKMRNSFRFSRGKDVSSLELNIRNYGERVKLVNYNNMNQIHMNETDDYTIDTDQFIDQNTAEETKID